MQPLALGAAFRRVISLMSTGLFLPTYSNTSMRGIQLSPAESDRVTAAAQTLVLVVAQGGYDAALGITRDKGQSNWKHLFDTIRTVTCSCLIHTCFLNRYFQHSDCMEPRRDSTTPESYL